MEKPNNGAEVLYTFFRNSFIHGYYGRAVFLTGDDTQEVEFRADGCVLLHPWWFYERFSNVARELLVEMFKEQQNGQLRRNALSMFPTCWTSLWTETDPQKVLSASDRLKLAGI